MAARWSNQRVGVSLSAVLAGLYVVVMLASQALVGVLTNGSWPATFLGIGWNAVIGFEAGLVVILIASFAIAAAFVPVYSVIWRWAAGQPKPGGQVGPIERPVARSWAFRVLITCLVLPVLSLLALHLLASAGIFAAPTTPLVAAASSDGRSRAVNLGPSINTAFREAEPSFTADGRTMYYNCHNGDICVSHLLGTWEAGRWTPPESLPALINTEYEEIEPVINGAGDKLYFTSTRPSGRLKGLPFLSSLVNVVRVINMLAVPRLGRSFFGGLGLSDVYVSHQVGGAWSEPQSLNDAAGEPPINTAFEDHCLSFSADGNEAFWTSTRSDGFGNDDIRTSRRVNGVWTEPENLGPNVNGPMSEHHSMPTPDGRSLYVTSDRSGGYGGDDIYVTTRQADGTWGPLINLGPLINGPGDDRCAARTPDLKIFLFDSVRPGGFGGRDLWWVYFADVPGYPLASASGGQARAVPVALRY